MVIIDYILSHSDADGCILDYFIACPSGDALHLHSHSAS